MARSGTIALGRRRRGEAVNTEDWRSAFEIFTAAKDLAPSERRKFVTDSGAAGHVVDQVLVMLEQEESEGDQTADVPAPGRTYGRYTIIELLGRGGMGEVYSARDAELGRRVALKFLGSKARLLPASMDRLIHEAQAASALNHPNLVTVYEILKTEGGVAIVTELVQGQPLRQHCGSPVPLYTVVFWGGQIARGLAAAHAENIVHGDIKPENVMVRGDGLLKIVDFGLAREGGAASGFDSLPVGTIGYMSPEQTRGVPLTGATDVFSLGVMLLEMLSGKHPFLEGTVSATTQAINNREASIPVPEAAPAGDRAFGRLLKSMLAKDPAQRPTALQVAAELDRISRSEGRGLPPSARWGIAAALAVAAAGGAAWFWYAQSASRSVLSFTPPVTLTTYAGVESQPSFSPDGKQIAFIWSGVNDDNRDVWVKSVDREDLRRLSTNPLEEFSPAWSPDGQKIGFLRRFTDGGDAQVLVVPATGGPERLIGTVIDSEGYRGMAWWPDSQSVVVRDADSLGRPLVRMFLDGRKQVLTSAADVQDRAPSLSPDGKKIVFLRQSAGLDRACVLRLDNLDVKCVPFRGNPRATTWLPDSKTFLISSSKTLWMGRYRDGEFVGALEKVVDGEFGDIASTSAGNRLAFTRTYSDINIWKLDVVTHRAVKFIASSEEDSEPEYSPDGEQILFRSARTGFHELYACNKDGTNVRQLTHLGTHSGSARWSADATRIVFDANFLHSGGQADKFDNIFLFTPASGAPPRRITDDSAERIVPNFSRDGRWIYYQEEPGSRRETWKIPADGNGAAIKVSDTEMFDIVESEDGKWLYFAKPRLAKGIWRRRIEGGPEEMVKGTETLVYRCWEMRNGRLAFLRSAGGDTREFVTLNLSTGVIKTVGSALPRPFKGPRMIAMSPDGSTILYTQEDLTMGDLMMMQLSKPLQ